MANGGDVLARGGKSATWATPNISQERWDEIFGKGEVDPETESDIVFSKSNLRKLVRDYGRES